MIVVLPTFPDEKNVHSQFGLTNGGLTGKIWAMLFESRHLRITSEYGTATLWLGFPGEPANALDLSRLRELDRALQFAASCAAVRILVLRSAVPHGFCAGLRPGLMAELTHAADRAALAWYGQQVAERLARLEAVTVALIDGPCLGAGFELSLACDYRLCVASPNTHLGFPERGTCLGGAARLRRLLGRRAERFLSSGETISGREAQALGLVDLAFCGRRARIELRSFLDQLELRPVKPGRPGELEGLAAERRAFAAATGASAAIPLELQSLNPVPAFPETIGLLGNDVEAAHLAAEAALLGSMVVVSGNRHPVYEGIDAFRTRGFITPLEAEQARQRVRSSEDLAEFRQAGLVFVSRGHNPFRLAATVLPRVVVCVIRSRSKTQNAEHRWQDLEVFPYPRRVVQIEFGRDRRVTLFPGPALDSDATSTLASWLKPLRRHVVVVRSSDKRNQVSLAVTARRVLCTNGT